MTTSIALLRAINVGVTDKLAMAELRRLPRAVPRQVDERGCANLENAGPASPGDALHRH